MALGQTLTDRISNLKTECLDWCYLEKEPTEATSLSHTYEIHSRH